MSSSEPESISLFDREKRRQICLYPQRGRETSYSEDDARSLDVVHHDLRVRFDPRTYLIEAEDTIRLNVLQPSATLRLRLDESLHIHSITSPEAGRHLFSLVRYQDSVMVSLGALAGRTGEISLTVRYGGAFHPGPVEREAIQAAAEGGRAGAVPVLPEDVMIEEVLVYSNRSAWYPQGGTDDYAQADLTLDVPQGYNAANPNPADRWPLMVCLHNDDQRMTDQSMIFDYGSGMDPRRDEKLRPAFPMIGICPQLPENRQWNEQKCEIDRTVSHQLRQHTSA